MLADNLGQSVFICGQQNITLSNYRRIQVLTLARTNTKLKKKKVNKKKGKPAPKRNSIVPAALFLLLTAGLIGLLYLAVGRHFPSRNLAPSKKSPAIVQPNSCKHRELTKKAKKKGRQPHANQVADRSTNLIIYRLSPDFSMLVKSSLKVNKNLTNNKTSITCNDNVVWINF